MFAMSVQEYIRPLASSLLDIDSSANPDPAVVRAMQQLALEFGEFISALLNFNVDAATILYTGQLTGGDSNPAFMDRAQYRLLVVSVLHNWEWLAHMLIMMSHQHGAVHHQ